MWGAGAWPVRRLNGSGARVRTAHGLLRGLMRLCGMKVGTSGPKRGGIGVVWTRKMEWEEEKKQVADGLWTGVWGVFSFAVEPGSTGC